MSTDDWYLDSKYEIVSESDVHRSYTYSARENNGATEIAIVSWFYRNPLLVALFIGTEIVAGTLFVNKKN